MTGSFRTQKKGKTKEHLAQRFNIRLQKVGISWREAKTIVKTEGDGKTRSLPDILPGIKWSKSSKSVFLQNRERNWKISLDNVLCFELFNTIKMKIVKIFVT